MPAIPGLGKRIAEIRDRRGLTQKELAEQADLSVSFLSEVENEHRDIGTEALLRIAHAIGASLDYLVKGTEPDSEESAKPLLIPPSLHEAAQQRGWSYSVTATVLAAQQSVVARRTPTGRAERPAREWTPADWIKLHASLRLDE